MYSTYQQWTHLIVAFKVNWNAYSEGYEMTNKDVQNVLISVFCVHKKT